jgi:hypothetical protein
MPIKLSIDHVARAATASAIGRIHIEDIREHLDGERVRGGLPYREFIDATRAVVDLSAEDTRSIVDLLRRMASRGALGPTAVIVSDDLSYGMLRMLQTLLGDVAEVRPFRAGQESEARSWLATAPIRDGGERG